MPGRPVQWREGHAYAYTQNIPYFPLIDLTNRTLQIREDDPPEIIKEKIDSRMAGLVGDKSEIAPYIGSLYALKHPEIDGVSPEYWKMQLQNSILIILSALAQRAPTVICFEDLHWADPSTVDLIRFLISEIKQPVIFICIYRPIITLFSSHQIKTLS